MIKFQRLKAKDCFSYGEMEVEFSDGLFAIEGKNGSSKSSVFLALQQCLFNKNAKGCKVEEVNNFITGKPYEIECEFTKDGDSYRVINSRKSGEIRIFRNDIPVHVKRIPENLAIISEILGCDYSMFCELTYQSKDSSLDILETGTDKGRKNFVNRILRLAEIDEQSARMKDKEKELAGKNGRIIMLNETISNLSATMVDTMTVEPEVDTALMEQELQDLTDNVKALSDIRKVTADAIDILKALQEAEFADQAHRKTIKELQTKLPEVSDDFDAEEEQAYCIALMQEYSATQVARTALISELKRAQEAEHSLKALAEYQEKLGELAYPEKSADECQVQLDKITKAQATKQQQKAGKTAELISLTQASQKGACPTCGHSIDLDAFAPQTANLEAEIVELEAFIRKCEESTVKYKNWLSLWKSITAIEVKIAQLEMITPVALDIEATNIKVAVMRTEMEINERERQSRQAFLTQYHQASKIREEIARIESKITGVVLTEAQAQELEELKGAACITLPEQLREAQLKLQIKSNDLRKAQDHNATVRAQIALNKQIDANNLNLRLKIDQLVKELSDKERKLDCIKDWNGILGNKGYRVAKISKFIQNLNKTMHRYSVMISGGRIKCAFFITDTGEIDFTITDEAKSMPYELWSGGEKARVKLVCLFSVLELLEIMGSTSFNVLALDEVFDQLDAAGKEGLFNILSFLRGKGKALYTIAHSELALDMMYDGVLKAVKLDDGTTTIQQ